MLAIAPLLLVAALSSLTVAICRLRTLIRQLRPTAELLRRDLVRLAEVIPLDAYEDGQSRYTHDDVRAYYAATSFRDYTRFLDATAMHTRLDPGFVRQATMVIAYMDETARRGGAVLEVGCGKGCNVLLLASRFPQAQVLGLDLLQAHVDIARRAALDGRLSNARFVQGNAACPPDAVRDVTYDLIFGVESLCHLDTDAQRTSFLDFAARALKPGGRLVIVDGFRSATFDGAPPDAQRAMRLAESGFRIRGMASKRTWKVQAAAAGFDLVDDVDLTSQAAAFWSEGWRVAHVLLRVARPLLRAYFSSSARAETRGNFVATAMTAHAMTLGSATYGILVLQKNNT